MNIKVAYQESLVTEALSRDLLDVIETIQSDSYKEIVQKIRSGPENAKNLKRGLPGFFPALNFTGGRTISDSSEVTGIVQFDIDAKDNDGLDIQALKEMVTNLPACVYAYISPSGGLKTGILTDFIKLPEEPIESVKARYRQAFNLVSTLIGQLDEIVFDETAGRITQKSYLSWDDTAYFNPIAKPYPVQGSIVQATEQPYREYYAPVDDEELQRILSYIPRNLDYDLRFRVNLAVLNIMGPVRGVQFLLNFWETDDRHKLETQLRSQVRYEGNYLNIGRLINIAKEYGYKSKVLSAKERKNQKALETTYRYPELLDIDSAKTTLQGHIDDFFGHHRSMLLAVSMGFGKTEEVLQVLRQIPHTKRVLVLVKNHALAKEIKSRFDAIPRPAADNFRDQLQLKSKMVHIYGKTFKDETETFICENKEIAKQYSDAGLSIPYQQCTMDCPLLDGCAYIRQFEEMANIRLQTHDELFNAENLWSGGVRADVHGNPIPTGQQDKRWIPDYIVVDENCIRTEKHIEDGNSKYTCIVNIIHSLRNGTTLKAAIQLHQESILQDYENQPESPKIHFKNAADYIKAQSSIQKPSKVLKRLYDYVVSGFDAVLLKGLYWSAASKKLSYHCVTPVNTRFQHVPKLYMDGTANPEVVKAVVPEIHYVPVKVKTNPDIKIYQLENGNYTISKLEKEHECAALIVFLRQLVSKYQDVGLITYMNLPNHENFYKYLGAQIGVSKIGYFGNIRGSDIFKDVDCLLIVGRQMNPLDSIKDDAIAVFGEITEFEKGKEDIHMNVPIRMRDGSSRTLIKKVYLDDSVAAVKKHFSDSETLQAIGRGRLIYGKPKDIFLFTSEGFEGELEVDGFFRVHDKEKECQDEIAKCMQPLRNQGYCQNTPAKLKALGFSDDLVEKRREQLTKALLDDGFKLEKFQIRDKFRKKMEREYFFSDYEKLVEGLDREDIFIIK